MMATLQHRLRELNAPYANGPYDTARIARGESTPPFQHRVLVPKLAVAASHRLGITLADTEWLVRFVSLAVLLLLLNQLLGQMTTVDGALIGCLLFACLLPLGFYVNPSIDSFPVMCVLIVGFGMLAAGSCRWLFLLVFLGTAIRETPILLAPVSAIALWGRMPRRHLAHLVTGQMLAWGAMKACLSLIYPGQAIFFAIGENVTHLTEAGFAAGLFRALVVLGPLGLALFGLRALTGSKLAFAMSSVGILYSCALLLVARINEPRAFYEANLLLTPSLMAAIGVWRDPSRSRGPA